MVGGGGGQKREGGREHYCSDIFVQKAIDAPNQNKNHYPADN